MYRTGHLGVALLVFAPIGYLFVAVGEPFAALVTGGAMLWLAMLPDLDHRIPGIPHRGPTHSLLFAVLVGVAFAGAGGLLADGVGVVDRARLTTFGFFVGFVAVGAHLLGDVLTPAGVNLFWPWGREFSLYLTRADNTIANYGLFLLGVFAVAAAGALALQGLP
ncbi:MULTISPECIES: metal-dependent hydrolase [Halolamina]|uniref:metal-dependent hydrolase n=1 Tax=Halolamina TaxID=1075397 RepID=UPI000944B7E5|nr:MULTISPECIES: metal-dependent hydrolase [Halolamina]NHX35842.1 metal-dependent hydrolase [Halolamina sp. R1-12]